MDSFCCQLRDHKCSTLKNTQQNTLKSILSARYFMSNPSLNDRPFADSTSPNSNAFNNPVAEQFQKLKQMVFTKDTARSLGQSLRLIFVVIRESLVLAWLALCWAIVAMSWLTTKTKQTSQTLKDNWTTFQESHQNQSASEIATETGKSVLNSSKSAIDRIVVEAKKQVGLNE